MLVPGGRPAQNPTMNDPMSIALSGLTAAGQRLNAAANNIANELDTSPLAPSTSQTQPPAYQPIDTVQTEAPGGGTIATYQPVTPASHAIYEPGSPFADANGLVAQPNVDDAQEITQALVAKQAYEANLAVMKTAQSLDKSTLNIFA
jgi:flagellar basal-body rod protein FlgC